ncbi:jg3903 [Pararge aegeria aegeria]|uniref:Jg3903 protein n=1 Tax=Pararge aegeria aegeria TaxID=348720 RepID=A0A8S4RV06_9NEOP|nr:jg3903 [Pararge aegeria aegeria]
MGVVSADLRPGMRGSRRTSPLYLYSSPREPTLNIPHSILFLSLFLLIFPISHSQMTSYNVSYTKNNTIEKTKDGNVFLTNESKTNITPNLSTELELKTQLDWDFNISSFNIYLALLNRFRRKETNVEQNYLETTTPKELFDANFNNHLNPEPAYTMVDNIENNKLSESHKKYDQIINNETNNNPGNKTKNNLQNERNENSKSNEMQEKTAGKLIINDEIREKLASNYTNNGSISVITNGDMEFKVNKIEKFEQGNIKTDKMVNKAKGKLKIDDETRTKLFFDYSKNHDKPLNNLATNNIINTTKTNLTILGRSNLKSDREETMGKLKIDDETRSKLFFDYTSTFNRSNSMRGNNESSTEKVISLGNTLEVGNENLEIESDIVSRNVSNNSLGPANLSYPSIKGNFKSTNPSFVDGE